jgi:hypothetical protein
MGFQYTSASYHVRNIKNTLVKLVHAEPFNIYVFNIVFYKPISVVLSLSDKCDLSF